MISKEENNRMDQELMDIVNSGVPKDRDKEIITSYQINKFIERQNEKKYNLSSENSGLKVALQEKSVSGTVSKKRYGLAKLIVIAGVVVTVVGSLSYLVSNLPIKGDANNKLSSDTVVVSQLDEGFNNVNGDGELFGNNSDVSSEENDLVDVSSKIEESSKIDDSQVEESSISDNGQIKDSSNVEDESVVIEEKSLVDDDSQVDESTNESVNDNSDVVFEVGTSSDIDDTRYYLENTIEGYLIRYYSKMYGLDPKIIAAICFQESGGVNIVDGGAAIGVMMLEDMPDYDITVYNYFDKCYETLTVSSSRAGDLEYNIRCGIANMQNKLNYFNGCIYAALQAYNYNEVTLDNALYANDYVLSGINDCQFLYITEDVTNNPQKYGISALDENGEEIYTKYGVSNYPRYTGYHLIDSVIDYNYISNGEIHEVEMNYATTKVIKDDVIDYISEKSL